MDSRLISPELTQVMAHTIATALLRLLHMLFNNFIRSQLLLAIPPERLKISVLAGALVIEIHPMEMF